MKVQLIHLSRLHTCITYKRCIGRNGAVHKSMKPHSMTNSRIHNSLQGEIALLRASNSKLRPLWSIGGNFQVEWNHNWITPKLSYVIEITLRSSCSLPRIPRIVNQSIETNPIRKKKHYSINSLTKVNYFMEYQHSVSGCVFMLLPLVAGIGYCWWE